MTVVDLFAGPGGADEGLRMAGVTDVIGIEWDADACATARAAGHERMQADVAELDPVDYPCDGLWASPPCQAWSMAGKRTAQADQARLGRHVEACRSGWTPYDPADYADARTPLVLEPLRWVDALRSQWVACEQVPPVLDLWGHYADVLRGWGYAVWCGVLNAADFGVPQTRRRAILMARREGPVEPPEPTHAKHPMEAGLFGGGRRPWVTMAQALEWGDDDDPSPTLTSGGCTTGGAEPYGRRSRAKLASRRDSPTWVDEHGERPNRADDEPAPSITGEAHRWQFVAAGETGEGRPRDPEDQPTATLGTKGTAYWINGNQAKYHWGHKMPATTIAGDPRMVGRAHDDEGSQGRDAVSVEEALRDGAEATQPVRVTVEQAAILQGFPPDYPWQGSKTSQFAQVGNAVPPPLAAAICSMLTNQEVAA